jgi:hypothetical protein
MNHRHFSLFSLLLLLGLPGAAQTPYYDQTKEGFLVFHPIKTDAQGHIIPWYSADKGEAYDFAVRATWAFWDTMRHDMNGLPYYMNHQVWRPRNDPRGLGGDQLQMALSSWQLLYTYTGDERVKENMKFMADYYLTHSLSPADAAWPNVPFPYNTLIYSGLYDGDMVIGKGYTQPDKAGSFGIELVKMYQLTGKRNYLDAAVAIANTLAKHTKPGDADNSPLPFKVNAFTGEVGRLESNEGDGSHAGRSSYTTNWAGTLQLFQQLTRLKQGDVAAYGKAFDAIVAWMKAHPLKTNKWGPFFEDIPGWSDTQINAVTFAQFMMDNPTLFPEWKTQVRGIFDWVYAKLGNDQWKKYGVRVVNEQTAYQTPGNSHTSRQASAELQYAALTGDNAGRENAVRQLDWATYMVNKDGKNNYPRDEVWLTDGYGDYVRHYLRAMAAAPELAPHADHILHATTVLYQADYAPDLNKRLAPEVPKDEVDRVRLFYRAFDKSATETIRLRAKPTKIMLNDKELKERMKLDGEGWTWQPFEKGGLLKVRHESGNTVKIF